MRVQPINFGVCVRSRVETVGDDDARPNHFPTYTEYLYFTYITKNPSMMRTEQNSINVFITQQYIIVYR